MASWSEIASAVRKAAAHATTSAPGIAAFQSQPLELSQAPGFDRKIARLDQNEARSWLERWCEADEAASVEWADGQVLLRNSRDLHLAQRVTSVQVAVRSGQGKGAGFASDAARRLEDLDLEGLLERARRRRTGEPPGRLRDQAVPLVLAPEATAELVEMLNHRAFAASAYNEGTSFLREHLGVQVFDQQMHLRDDGSDPKGLVFPFDLEGRPKKPVLLIKGGVPRTPTLDGASALTCGLEATGHAVCSGVGYALNLFMDPGNSSEEELLRAGEGGLWISRLERVECFDPSRMLIRARARGVRLIGKGHLRRPLPDLVWEDSLLRIFASLGGLGRTTARRLSADGVLGGICAPAVVLGSATSLELA